MARNNELIRLAKKAADEWRNTDAYYQAAQIIDMLVEELESNTLTQPNEGAKDKNVPTNEPLTWEELEKLKNSPVYIELIGVNSYWAEVIGVDSYWALVRDINDCGVWLMTVDDIDDYGSHRLYSKTWIAYRRPPEGEEET